MEFCLQASRLNAQPETVPSLIALILLFPSAKRLTLRQARRISRLEGQNVLRDLFRKINPLQLPRVENAKRRHGWTARLWPMPNTTERFKNLTDEIS